MKNAISRFVFVSVLLCLVAVYDAAGQQGDEAAIKQIVQTMQDGWNKKDGKMFASHFAEEHDYVNVWGLYLPKASRDGNAKAHQGLFDGPYKEVDAQFRVAKIRFLSPDIAVMHIQGYTHGKGKVEDKRQDVIISGVLQKKSGKWEVVAFQNTPVNPPTYGPPPVKQ
ncbi:MAG: SgcJ/EcaC family oxidoreductase [Acidobacteria bacterium]|nr:SgcJ/EcaC family oxidoreductase [Acidobacteriota bacterium]MBP7475895.1 SgcJ/EcaC family oxidoreductase [Pyrinomonadaceae bacterium]